MTDHRPDHAYEPPRPPATDAIYARLALYVLSSTLTMIPLAWSDWVSYDAATQMLQVSIPGLVAAVIGGLAITGGVFAKWGRKR